MRILPPLPHVVQNKQRVGLKNNEALSSQSSSNEHWIGALECENGDDRIGIGRGVGGSCGQQETVLIVPGFQQGLVLDPNPDPMSPCMGEGVGEFRVPKWIDAKNLHKLAHSIRQASEAGIHSHKISTFLRISGPDIGVLDCSSNHCILKCCMICKEMVEIVCVRLSFIYQDCPEIVCNLEMKFIKLIWISF